MWCLKQNIYVMQEKFENFFKIFVVDPGYLWFKTGFLLSEWTQHSTLLACFFVINLSTVALFVLDECFDCLMPWVKA